MIRKNTLKRWFDNQVSEELQLNEEAIDWFRIIPFLAIHLCCLLVFVVGFSVTAIVLCVFSYFIRMFAITAFYHRYFSHRSFRTSRKVQFFFAIIGASATQRGPLWWAAHHRHHHINSDRPQDTHSPQAGFIHSHMSWFLKKKNFATNESRIADLKKYPELQFIDRYDILFPILYALTCFLLGYLFKVFWPSLGIDQWQALIWGYFISTVLLMHITFCINSLAHLVGSRTYHTNDNSRNNFVLALLSLGEGWHNNHHCYPGSVKQGFQWWQIDISYYLIKIMEKCGLVWELKYPNNDILENKKIKKTT